MRINRVLMCVLLPLAIAPMAFSQVRQDTVRTLDEIVVHGFASDRPIGESPVAIGYLTPDNFKHFNSASMLSAVNVVPGVRMEERSPGSYRFSIRGSLLRSPFGVRNVKMYWNGLPITDAGGNTYLNLLDQGWIQSMEIIKGPGSSLYGSGTGGVVLFKVPDDPRSLNVEAQTGGFGTTRFAGDVGFANGRSRTGINISFLSSDGYREQSALDRFTTGLNWQMDINDQDKFELLFLSSSLNYETPGGLTFAQYNEDPVQARPSTATQPGSVDQHAEVSNLTSIFGTTYLKHWNDRWSTRLGAIGTKTYFENPSIRNVEQRHETNIGARLETFYNWRSENLNGKLTWGGEFQLSKSLIDVFDNNLGIKGSAQTLDDIDAINALAFAQVEFDTPSDWYFTLGGSLNFLNYDFERTFPQHFSQTRKFDIEPSPRVAILKKISQALSLYANMSRGFSPPGLAEVRPSTNNFNPDLNAERGLNLEGGVKGNLLKERLYFDVALYNFRLNETIVIQRADDGADYFVNAGETEQNGIEAFLSWRPDQSHNVFRLHEVWMSYTYQNYHFRDYIQDGNDFSDNDLTGVPPVILNAGVSFNISNDFDFVFTGNFTDHIPLNDGNTAYAESYILLGGRANYRFRVDTFPAELYAGVDNALNEKYSLGNDLNAFGGRYYNAAAPRNYFLGLKFRFTRK